MEEWQPIETAPRTGEPVHVRRVYNGRVVKEGKAVFGFFHKDAPSRYGLGADGLGRMSAADYAREDAARKAFTETPRWLKEDRMYAFPEPTEWLPGA